MADQSSQSGAGQPAPPSDAAPEAYAGAQGASKNAAPNGAPARPPLGEWRGPVFWMACGALLAGLAAGVVALVQRVGVERDMMAVAATLPQSAPQDPRSLPPAATRPPPGADTGAAPSSALALRPSASLSASGPAAREARPVGAKALRRHSVSRPSAMAVKLQAPGKQARRTRAAANQKYAAVFKRCPASGMPGALQCRRDICNGAERKGPACKPYVRKQP